MNVCMQFEREKMLLNWTSSFGNEFFGYQEHLLGTHGTVEKKNNKVRYIPEKANRPGAAELLGSTPDEDHMRNFVDAIRLGIPSNAPFDLGFRTSIACRMCVDSYLQGRTLKWDREREIIV
jgi:hypothetical protein